MSENNNEEKMKKDVKSTKRIAKKVVWGAVAFGSVFLLGTYKGIGIGHASGRLEGYAEATRDIAEMIQQSVNANTGE